MTYSCFGAYSSLGMNRSVVCALLAYQSPACWLLFTFCPLLCITGAIFPCLSFPLAFGRFDYKEVQAESWSPKGEKPDYFPHPPLLECLLYLPVGLQPLRPWLLTPPFFGPPVLEVIATFCYCSSLDFLSHPSCFPPLPSPMWPVPYNWFLLCEILTVLDVSWLDFVDCYLCQWTGVSMSSSPCWCPAQNLFARQVNPTSDCYKCWLLLAHGCTLLQRIALAHRYLWILRWFSGKEPVCQCRRCKRLGFDPWVGKIFWRRA